MKKYTLHRTTVTYPTWGKEAHLQNYLGRGYIGSLEGTSQNKMTKNDDMDSCRGHKNRISTGAPCTMEDTKYLDQTGSISVATVACRTRTDSVWQNSCYLSSCRRFFVAGIWLQYDFLSQEYENSNDNNDNNNNDSNIGNNLILMMS